MKTNAIVRIVLFSIAILVLGGILAGGMLIYTFSVNTDWVQVGEFMGGFIASNDGTVASSGKVSPSDVKNLEIDWTSGSVTIHRAEVDTISFAETPGLDENQKMIWKLQGNTLVINNSRYRVVIGISKSKDLIITVPMDWNCGELEIDTVSAHITVDSLTAQDVAVSAVDGKCDFTGTCAIDDLNIETVNGDVLYKGTLKKLEYEGVNADFRGTFTAAPSKLNLNSVDGDIEVRLPDDTGFTAVLDTVSGNFTSRFPTTNSGNRYVYGDGSCVIEIDSVSGDLTINRTE